MGLLPYKNEPYLDWSDDSNQEAMRAALDEVEGSWGKSYPLIIGGEPIETDGEIISVNPSDPSQVVGRVGRATEREADMALETATKTLVVEPDGAGGAGARSAQGGGDHAATQVRDARLGGLRGRQALGRG